MPHEEPSMRHQLVEARTKIIAQIDQLKYGGSPSGYTHPGGVADNSALIAEFEDQLREIDALLGGDETREERLPDLKWRTNTD